MNRGEMMHDTATVKIFLVKGSPTSIRTAEISNWTGKALAGPRSQIEEILKREEADKPGVYFLSGINPETGKERIYIGEAESIRERIRQHLSWDFWKSIVIFVSKDENLTKAHIKYLEGKLIAATKESGRVELENSQSSGSHLPESDTADMDIFLYRMEQLLPLLGQDFLKPIGKSSGHSSKNGQLYCDIKGLRAKGRLSENGLVVFKGSEAVLQERPSAKKYQYSAKLREKLREDGVLKKENDRLIFTRDYEFSSPSAAAAVVHGGSENGLIAWKDSKGRTLKEIEESEIQ